jgi:hypothetical protein
MVFLDGDYTRTAFVRGESRLKMSDFDIKPPKAPVAGRKQHS